VPLLECYEEFINQENGNLTIETMAGMAKVCKFYIKVEAEMRIQLNFEDVEVKIH